MGERILTKYVCLWSGGKESCFALWKAICSGLEVCYLLNFTDKESNRSRTHGIDRQLIALQAQAIEIPIIQKGVTWETYEIGFKEVLSQLKEEGITGVIAGDLDIQEHRNWLEKICGEIGFTVVLPLWGMEPKTVLVDFVAAGFRALIVSVKAELFTREWLGRKVNKKLIKQLAEVQKSSGIHLCGESGEYHTFVYNGPLFKRAIRIGKAVPVLKDKKWFLDILDYGLG